MDDRKRIAILTSGGDCPGLNAVIRAAVAAAYNLNWEVIGFIDGFEGMLNPVRYRKLDARGCAGILSMGGTILGTTNRGRFAGKVADGKKAKVPDEIMLEAKQTLEGLGVSATIVIGGDGSLTTAEQLQEWGMPVVGVPKTIDNDLSATAMTFGFDSATQVVCESLDRLHTTAASHRRVLVVEVMGRHAGWIALHGGVAGAADAILIPEIPYCLDSICNFVTRRFEEGFLSTMIVVAEGAKPLGGAASLKGKGGTEHRLGGIGETLAEAIMEQTDRESRAVVLGHLQRGGAPTTLDRMLGTRFGVAAVDLIREGKFGHMVSYQNYEVGSVPIADAVGSLKTVPPNGQVVRIAKEIGIHFGEPEAEQAEG